MGIANCGTSTTKTPVTPTPYPDDSGTAGESAYQIAVDNGFAGTETDWLASLAGPKGDPGNDGTNGQQGIQGVQGEQGPAGNSFNLKGAVLTADELPADSVAGDAYWVGSGSSITLYIFTADGWNVSPDLVGPQGIQGVQGIQGLAGVVDWSGVTAANIRDAVIQILKDEGLIQ